MPQRRLPNGRFARVVDIPERKRREGPKASGGAIIVRTNSHIARGQLEELRRRVPQTLLADAERRASAIQERIRKAMLIEYTQGTGRAARGVFARVSKSKMGDSDQVVIRITNTNYREMNFLTNIGGSGYFKSFPVGPYRIFAKGAQERLERVNSATGEVSLVAKSTLRQVRGKIKHRLKIPKEGVLIQGVRGPGGSESRVARGIPVDATLQNFQNVSQFFYPLWVNHPGFQRDVISEIALQEGAAYITETEELVRFAHLQIAPGQFVSAEKGREPIANMAVSREIPINSITLTRAGLRHSSGSSRPNLGGWVSPPVRFDPQPRPRLLTLSAERTLGSDYRAPRPPSGVGGSRRPRF